MNIPHEDFTNGLNEAQIDYLLTSIQKAENFDRWFTKQDKKLIQQNNQLKKVVEEIKELREFHSGKGTVPRFSHADIFNELSIVLKNFGDSTS